MSEVPLYRTFIKSQLSQTQLTSRPGMVHIRSRSPAELEGGETCAPPSSLLLSCLELGDTKVYEPQIRALLGTAAHFCEVVVLERAKPLYSTEGGWSVGCRVSDVGCRVLGVG